jgi:hypothetical protein
MDPEIAGSFFEDHLTVSFSRIPRNWGPGIDSLLLSEMASPFLSFSIQAKVFPWMDYSFLAGTLENFGDSTSASALQALVSMRSVDVRPTDWLYIGVHEAVVFPKRLELGYMNPLIFSSLYQGMIGDFDNILGGLSAGFSLPGYIDFYGSFFFDEFRPTSFTDLSERVRNFFSYQAGLKSTLPLLSFATLSVQYTKIEPFTYTHPATEVPWLTAKNSVETGGRVYESFISNGAGIASKLDPNSDELLIKVEGFITPAVKLRGSYQLIRHGEYGGDYTKPLDSYKTGEGDNGILPDGMVYPVWLEGAEAGDVTSVEKLRKKFLHDGDYDWYHIAAIGVDADVRKLLQLPIRLTLTNSLVYYFRNDSEGNRIEAESAGWTNYVSLSIKVWG